MKAHYPCHGGYGDAFISLCGKYLSAGLYHLFKSARFDAADFHTGCIGFGFGQDDFIDMSIGGFVGGCFRFAAWAFAVVVVVVSVMIVVVSIVVMVVIVSIVVVIVDFRTMVVPFMVMACCIVAGAQDNTSHKPHKDKFLHDDINTFLMICFC